MGESKLKSLNPASIAAPFGNYSHGVALPAGAALVMTSGQLPLAADGSVPDGARAQADLCFQNCEAIITEAGLGPADVVRIVAYVTDRAHMKDYMAARDAWLGQREALPASTLLIVTGFTRPEFLVEVEVTAARMPAE
ncbi:MAG: RidA family protein [Pseudomonadota bacterium]